MYTFAGETAASGTINNALSVYDSSGNSWSTPTVAGPPSARINASAVVLGGKIYIFGGRTNTFPYMFLSDLWAFDPSGSGSWHQLSPTGTGPVGLTSHSAVAIAGKMYIFGGAQSGFALTNQLFVYDPALGDGSWMQISASGAPSARSTHSAVADGTKMYVFGGYDGNLGDAASGSLNDLYVFETQTGAWSQATPAGTLPPERRGHSAVVMNTGMYVFAGTHSGLAVLSDLWRYDFVANQWSQPMPTGSPAGRQGHTAVVMSGQMWIFGGVDSSSIPKSDLQAYTP